MSVIAPAIRFAILVILGASIAACRDPFIGCEPPRPQVLPDGSTPEMVARQTVRGHQPESVWGSGRGEVHVVGFHHVGDRPDIGSETKGVTVRGQPARVNDLDDSLPAIEWRAAGCEYHLWLDPTLTRNEVIEYAGRY